MNHFELFEIPVSFFPDLNQMRQKYYELSRLYHPDLQEDDTNMSDVLERSSQLNEAYKVLQSFTARVHYVLQLKGEIKEEEKAELPPAFLMEMMEVNESLMDAKMEGDDDVLRSVLDEIDQLHSGLIMDWEQSCRQYDEKQDASLLSEIKSYYLKNQYLRRLKAQA